MWTAWWAMASAWAEMPLPSYRDQVARAAWAALDERLERGCVFQPAASGVVCADGVTDSVTAAAKAFRKQVYDDAGIAYLQGLAHRYAGEERAAQRAWEQAVALDPDQNAAWYDLGELHLVAGRFDAAEQAFQRVAELAETSPMPWLGHQRLAEVAALRHDEAAFERHVKEALAHGFSFRQVADWPNWRSFYADPALRDTMEKLLTVYATEDVKQQLGAPLPAER